ncbi:PAS domain S-box protein, partial [Pontibacter ummariensis]|uniref:PAS domain S-box protein n=1 Tax=Pontibacter ummariensis TaxID=1610492 RepID=UPI001FE8990A
MGYSSEELTGKSYARYLIPEDVVRTREVAKSLLAGERLNNFTNTYFHKNGQQVHLRWSGFWSEEEEAFVCVARDVTEENLAQQKLREKDELHSALVEHGADIISLVDEEGNFLYRSGAGLALLGYSPVDLIGQSVFEFIHPADVAQAKAALTQLLTSKEPVTIAEFRFRTAAGEWRWLESTASNQLHSPSVRALVISSRDITERVESQLLQLERNQQFKSLFENHVDAVVYQNREGILLDANPATLSLLGMPKADVINRPFSEFLPTEVIPVCKSTLQEAFRGEPVRFEVAMPLEADTKYLDIIKIPVSVGGETIGVYSILRDVTEIHNAHQVIERQAEKLDTILSSVTDSFIALDKEWRFSYVNSVFAKQGGHNQEELLGKNIWEVFPRISPSKFRRQCEEAAKEGTAKHFEERYAYS